MGSVDYLLFEMYILKAGFVGVLHKYGIWAHFREGKVSQTLTSAFPFKQVLISLEI